MSKCRVVSTDSHITEPQDLWTSRIEPKYRDRCPRLMTNAPGYESHGAGEVWVCDGRGGNTPAQGAQAGVRFEDPEKLKFMDTFERMRPGGYIPEEHVKDMDLDGVDFGIVYPSCGLRLYGTVPDGDLLDAVIRVYNDFATEFCSAYPKRLGAIAMINLDDVQLGVREMERCRKMGALGAMITVYPPEGRRYNSPEYDAVWAAGQDLEMPIGLHLATDRWGAGESFQTEDTARIANTINSDHAVRMSLCDIIFAGVFERYPKLQMGAIEHELSWVPHLLDRMDYNYTQRSRGRSGYQFKNDMMPSDFFHRNLFVGFQEDGLGIRLRDIIGVDNLTWGSDYPHQESTFPKTQEILDEILADCTEEERSKIVGGNAARIYKI